LIIAVTRHPALVAWLGQEGISIDSFQQHLDISGVSEGDIVVGNLPVHLAAEVCEKGASYVNISVDVPRELRGQELSLADLERYDCRLEGYSVIRQPGPDKGVVSASD